MSENEIARLLVRRAFPYRRYLCVPNVDWGLLPNEADLVAMAPSGWLYEVEIKASLADLRRDLQKWRHRRSPNTIGCEKIRGMYYAMPAYVWEKVEAEPPIPQYAGVLAFTDDRVRVVRKPKLNSGARKLTDGERYKLARLGVMRYWSRDREFETAAVAVLPDNTLPSQAVSAPSGPQQGTTDATARKVVSL